VILTSNASSLLNKFGDNFTFLIVPQLTVSVLIRLSEIDRFHLSRFLSKPLVTSSNLLRKYMKISLVEPLPEPVSPCQNVQSSINQESSQSSPSSFVSSDNERQVKFVQNSKSQIGVSWPVFEIFRERFFTVA
jgi:hypothetical protein